MRVTNCIHVARRFQDDFKDGVDSAGCSRDGVPDQYVDLRYPFRERESESSREMYMYDIHTENKFLT